MTVICVGDWDKKNSEEIGSSSLKRLHSEIWCNFCSHLFPFLMQPPVIKACPIRCCELILKGEWEMCWEVVFILFWRGLGKTVSLVKKKHCWTLMFNFLFFYKHLFKIIMKRLYWSFVEICSESTEAIMMFLCSGWLVFFASLLRVLAPAWKCIIW